MAQDRKYAALPDLDSAPDVYETRASPVDEHDTQTRSPSPSTRSSPSPPASDNEDSSRPPKPPSISRHGLSPARARASFKTNRVDGRAADFSDRIDSDRAGRSYRTSHGTKKTGRQRRREVYADYGGSDEEGDDDDETIEERIARLKREVEEVKGMRQKDSKQEDVGIGELSHLLKELSSNSKPARSAPSLPPSKTDREAATNGKGEDTSPAPPRMGTTTQKQNEALLSRASTLESRLATLESAMGLHALPVNTTNDSTSSSALADKPLLTTLALLESQLATLAHTLTPAGTRTSNGTTAPLEQLSANIQRLTQDAQNLETARQKATKALQEKQHQQQGTSTSRPYSSYSSASRPSSFYNTQTQPRDGSPSKQPSVAQPPPDIPDPDTGLLSSHMHKVSALHAALPTLESLAPLLPAVLERLRTLARLHADAGVAADGLREVERRQGECAVELGRWREGLERVEERMRQGGGEGNVEAVEGWVRRLEERVANLEGVE